MAGGTGLADRLGAGPQGIGEAAPCRLLAVGDRERVMAEGQQTGDARIQEGARRQAMRPDGGKGWSRSVRRGEDPRGWLGDGGPLDGGPWTAGPWTAGLWTPGPPTSGPSQSPGPAAMPAAMRRPTPVPTTELRVRRDSLGSCMCGFFLSVLLAAAGVAGPAGDVLARRFFPKIARTRARFTDLCRPPGCNSRLQKSVCLAAGAGDNRGHGRFAASSNRRR